jgi:dienelactone hydrolase
VKQLGWALVLCVGISARAAWALPEDPGKFKHQKVSRTATLAGKTVTFDVYIPNGAGLGPAVVLGHGFARNKAQMAGWGGLLASRGFVALAPNFPGGMAPDHKVNGKVMSALLAWAVADSAKAGSPIKGLVDAKRLGVMGHSAGGLAAVLAASADSKIRAVVGLDPVDNGGLGKAAAALIKVPVTIIRAEPGACNSAGNAAAIFGALTGPRLSLQVIKGTHCDPEWPSGILCTLACGATDAKRQAHFRRYAMATLDHVLGCALNMGPWLGGASAKADSAIKGIAATGYPPPKKACLPSPDAGVPDSKVASPDLALTKDQAIADRGPDSVAVKKDAAPAADVGATAGPEDEGCECGVGRDARGGSGSLLVLLLFAVLLGGRRRG